jgi:hypothetical protein
LENHDEINRLCTKHRQREKPAVRIEVLKASGRTGVFAGRNNDDQVTGRKSDTRTLKQEAGMDERT